MNTAKAQLRVAAFVLESVCDAAEIDLESKITLTLKDEEVAKITLREIAAKWREMSEAPEGVY